MKAVILAGGLGTRIAEETHLKPKPMVSIGGRPILWHIMKIYSAYGINDFIICCGYKGYVIKEYFANYYLHMSDVTFDMRNNSMNVHRNNAEDWNVTLVDTGLETMTGGRLKRVSEYIEPNEPFCFTYGDGVSDVDITNLINFHVSSNKMATVTAVAPPSRYGAIEIDEGVVSSFVEKPVTDKAKISGGFFVLSPQVFDLISDDHVAWEAEPMEKLAEMGQLAAFNHTGFWHPMDTLRDQKTLQNLWEADKAPWKIWV